MPGSPHYRRTSFNRETARCEDDGVSRHYNRRHFHCSPHRGCPMVWANATNMTLKLMLILMSSLWLASTECGNQAGKTISVLADREHHLIGVVSGELGDRWPDDRRLRLGSWKLMVSAPLCTWT